MGRWGSVTIRWGQVDADVTWLYICCGGEAWGGRGGGAEGQFVFGTIIISSCSPTICIG